MKKMVLLMTLGLIALKSFSQEAFKLGTTYRQGWLVWYPDNNPANYYISKPISLVATKTPNLDPSNWIKVPVPVPVPVPVKQKTLKDTLNEIILVNSSLLQKADSLDIRIKRMERQWLSFGVGFEVRQTDTLTIINLKPVK